MTQYQNLKYFCLKICIGNLGAYLGFGPWSLEFLLYDSLKNSKLVKLKQ